MGYFAKLFLHFILMFDEGSGVIQIEGYIRKDALWNPTGQYVVQNLSMVKVRF